MQTDPLRELFRHHIWATRALIAHCATLSPEALELTVPGTAGTIRHTLVHLVGADGRYLSVFTGAQPTVRESAPPSLDALDAAFADQAGQWEQLLDRADTLDVTLPSRGAWPDTPHAQNLLLVQAIHHGNDHRTHICTILGANGMAVPDLSGWEYWRVTRMGT